MGVTGLYAQVDRTVPEAVLKPLRAPTGRDDDELECVSGDSDVVRVVEDLGRWTNHGFPSKVPRGALREATPPRRSGVKATHYLVDGSGSLMRILSGEKTLGEFFDAFMRDANRWIVSCRRGRTVSRVLVIVADLGSPPQKAAEQAKRVESAAKTRDGKVASGEYVPGRPIDEDVDFTTMSAGTLYNGYDIQSQRHAKNALIAYFEKRLETFHMPPWLDLVVHMRPGCAYGRCGADPARIRSVPNVTDIAEGEMAIAYYAAKILRDKLLESAGLRTVGTPVDMSQYVPDRSARRDLADYKLTAYSGEAPIQTALVLRSDDADCVPVMCPIFRTAGLADCGTPVYWSPGATHPGCLVDLGKLYQVLETVHGMGPREVAMVCSALGNDYVKKNQHTHMIGIEKVWNFSLEYFGARKNKMGAHAWDAYIDALYSKAGIDRPFRGPDAGRHNARQRSSSEKRPADARRHGGDDAMDEEPHPPPPPVPVVKRHRRTRMDAIEEDLDAFETAVPERLPRGARPEDADRKTPSSTRTTSTALVLPPRGPPPVARRTVTAASSGTVRVAARPPAVQPVAPARRLLPPPPPPAPHRPMAGYGSMQAATEAAVRAAWAAAVRAPVIAAVPSPPRTSPVSARKPTGVASPAGSRIFGTDIREFDMVKFVLDHYWTDACLAA
jgi:hypothetical protein